MADKRLIKYNALFCKKGNMVYISHLDLMKLFRRAFRRADVPFVLSKGFTPRVKISMPKALKLGRESDSEEMWFWLSEEMDCGELTNLLNHEFPEGIKVFKIKKEKSKVKE